jgi:hypothetical protein
MIIICDIDGTIADGSQRDHLIQTNPKNWEAYFKLCSLDKPIEPVLEFVYLMWACFSKHGQSGHSLSFVSGRSDMVKTETEEWLKKHCKVPVWDLIMRPQDDTTQDDVLKERFLKEHFLDKEILKEDIIVIDDRERVVDMWRNNGILCLQPCRGFDNPLYDKNGDRIDG